VNILAATKHFGKWVSQRAPVVKTQLSDPASFRANAIHIGNIARFFQKIGPQPFRLA